MPHSEKSAVSAKQSEASRKDTAKLTTKLLDLTSKADWAQGRADFHWENAKNYELIGRMDMALEEKTLCERETKRAKCYKVEIEEIEKMIDKLSLVYSVGLKKRENYANKKVEDPPSDDED